ncbi:MAG: hypothetical protein AB7O78_01545 [Thermoleophilia bacterium]
MAAKRTTCRSCGAPIILARHDQTGRWAPLQPDPEGRWTLWHEEYFEASPRLSAEHRFTSHYAVCPRGADQQDAA